MDQSQKNVLVQERVVSPLSLLVNQLKSPLVFVLIFAALITTALAEYVDTLFILVAIAINSALGFYQEYKAENTLQQLKKLINPKAVIVRNGKKFTIELAEVMVGDIAELTIEHQIPADGELVEAMGLTVNEAILTGESVPVHKSHGDMIYAGTRLLTGHGYMKVKSIGGNTSIGKIGASVSSISDTKTPLQHQLGKLARYLSIIAALCAALLFLVGLLYGYELSEISTTAVAVAVASIPEGLVVTLTVILAVGMQKVSKQQAIVRKLLAAETLGSVTTVCVDKTGTVTEGVLNVVQEDFIDNDLAYRSIRLSENGSDPLEIAMRQWLEMKHSSQVVSGSWEVSEKMVDGIPFNSKQKYTALLGESSGGKILYIFGAPEVLLDKSTIDKNSRELWEARIAEYASKGKKVIGFAYKEYKENKKLSKKDISRLEWNGLLALDDPIRQGVIESIRECQSAGINFKMITGDYLETGIAVMKQLGLLDDSYHAADGTAITGVELKKLSDDELRSRVGKIILFARTDPIQKLRIVEALRANGEVIAMTGDGVNDSPALKSADIGIVVKDASDISKEVADMVLLDSNFGTIVRAVEEGRAMFDNIKKTVMYLLIGSFSELILVMGAILLQLPLPITALQILWVNLVEDALPALSLAFEPKEGDLLKQPPRSKNEHILDRQMLKIIALFVLIADAMIFLIFYYLHRESVSVELMRTVVFVGVGINSLFYIFACKSLRHTIFSYNPFSNRFMVLSVLIGIGALIVGVQMPIFNLVLGTVPLSLGYWTSLFGLGLLNLLLFEVIKVWVNRGNRSTEMQLR